MNNLSSLGVKLMCTISITVEQNKMTAESQCEGDPMHRVCSVELCIICRDYKDYSVGQLSASCVSLRCHAYFPCTTTDERVQVCVHT